MFRKHNSKVALIITEISPEKHSLHPCMTPDEASSRSLFNVSAAPTRNATPALNN